MPVHAVIRLLPTDKCHTHIDRRSRGRVGVHEMRLLNEAETEEEEEEEEEEDFPQCIEL